MSSIAIQFDPEGYDGGDEIWTTEKGKQIPIKHMTDEHLRNTIFFIQRRLGFLVGKYAGKYGSHKPLQELLDKKPGGVYDALRLEANRRGLPWI